MLKYAILGFLSYRPFTGYDLKQHLDHSTQFFWQAKQSQIYRTLKQLEGDKLVTSEIFAQEERPDKRIYTITDSGRQDLHHWLHAPMKDISPYRDSLLLKIFFGADIDFEDLKMQLMLQKRLHEARIREYDMEIQEFIQEAVDENPMLETHAKFWDHTRKFGIQFSQMYIESLDETLKLIEELKTKQPS